MKIKKSIVAISAIFVFGGSAGAGYYLMSRSAEAVPVDVADEDYVDPVKDPKYVEVDALLVPVIINGFVDHHVFLELSLEVDGKPRAQTILDNKARLHHAFYMALYDEPTLTAADAGVLDPERIKQVVMRQSKEVLGSDIVKAVHIQNAVRG